MKAMIVALALSLGGGIYVGDCGGEEPPKDQPDTQDNQPTSERLDTCRPMLARIRGRSRDAGAPEVV